MKMWHRILLVTLSALFAILSFEPFAFWLLAFIAWIPLLIAIRGVSFRAAVRLGLLQGFLTFAGTLSWLWSVFYGLAPILWIVHGVFPAIFAGLATRVSGKFQPLLLALLWTGIEYFRSEIFSLSFPWITPGTAIPPNFLTSIIGVYGVSFLVILASSVWVSKGIVWKIGGLVIWNILINSAISPPEFTISKPQDYLTVALVQNEGQNYDDFRRTSESLKSKADVIVWPEYSIGLDPHYVKNIQSEIGALLDDRATLLVSGGKTWHDPNQESWSNTAYTFSKDDILGTHVKNHTVHFFDDGEKGTTAKPIETPFGKIGTPICFDCDHQDVIRRMTANGAEFFLIPSMDAAHWSARQHLQHATLFRHRAAENGRWLAIASSSGVTQIINPYGRTIEQLPLMDEGILIGNIAKRTQLTLFQQGGWLFGPICFGGTLLFILITIQQALKNRCNRKLLADVSSE